MHLVIRTRTDSAGRVEETRVVDPPGPFRVTVEVKARIAEPAGVAVRGTLRIDPEKGDSPNAGVAFELGGGQQQSLGRWKLGGGRNVVRISGETVPPAPDADVAVELDVSLSF